MLPFNQGIQDGMRGIQLDDFSLFLWDHIENCNDSNELLKLVTENYDVESGDIPQLKKEINRFVAQLYQIGFLKDDHAFHFMSKGKKIKIGGINIQINCDETLLHQSFNIFTTDFTSEPDLYIQVIDHVCRPTKNGTVLIRNEELIVMDCEDRYIILNYNSENHFEFHIFKDGKYAEVYCNPLQIEKEDLFHCIRMIYLYTAMKHGLYAIHSVSVSNEGKAVLFSALSGTGKSTHAGIWEKVYGTPMINGDLNLIGIENEEAKVYGIPWCGTSGIYSKDTYPLEAVVLLKRGNDDYIQELSEDQKVLMVQQRMISPFWTEEDFSRSLDFAQDLIKIIKVCRAYVTMKDSAAVTVKEYIDNAEN